MHNFDELISDCTSFTLGVLEKANNKVLAELQESASTRAVKNLQTFQLQKVILATGMFSIFDARLQDALSTKDGFKRTKEILVEKNKLELYERFNVFICAINVLKHGRGKSYDFLVEKFQTLPFKVKLPGENFFLEGDVSEVSTLIEVNDKFVLDCARLIEEVSELIKNSYPVL